MTPHPLPAHLATSLATASRAVASHRRQSLANELALCIDDATDAPALAATLTEIRALLLQTGEGGAR